MGRSRRRRRRVEGRRSLVCATCGAGNRLTDSALEHGWSRCAHCDTPLPVPGRGDFAIEGPAGRVTRVVRPGSSEFETSAERVLSQGRVIVGIVAADIAIEGSLWGAQQLALATPAWLGASLYTWLAVSGALCFLLATTRQRLEIRDGSLDFWWVTLGRRWQHRRLATRRFRTSVIGEGRTGVAVESPGGRIFVRMQGDASLRWLEREIVAAVKDARSPESGDRVACPGCGGPVAREKELRDAGGIDCPHCGVGLVQTEGGIALPAARVGHDLHAYASGELPHPRRAGDAIEWSTPPWATHHPLGSVLCLILCSALSVGLAVGGVWAIGRTPHLKSLVAILVLLVNYGNLVLWPEFLVWMYGRYGFRLGPALLEHEVHIGRWRCRWHRIPLARLVSLHASWKRYGDGGPAANVLPLQVKLASSQLDLEVYDRRNAPMLRAVVEATSGALRALGRTVEGCPKKKARA